jgi:O-methyltransferase
MFKRYSKLPGKLKGLFLNWHLHVLVPSKYFLFFGHIALLSRWIQKHKKTLKYTDFYSSKFDYTKRLKMFEFLIEHEQLDANIDYLEFGVSKGDSFRWWIANIKHPDAKFYGFDTFSGLPEDWGPFKKGEMDNGNQKPVIDDQRHQFYQGLFQQTLVPFLADYKTEKRKIIHLDADLYSATLYVLTLITPYLKPGDILLFDEFNVPMHEYKAFKEWSESFYIKYEVLASVNNYYQVAIKIK